MKSLLLLPLMLFTAAAGAASLRCGSSLITSGDHAFEVLEKCGEPVSRSHLGYRRRGDLWGSYVEVRIDEWIYGPRNGMYYYLRFEGERLTEIDSQRRQ